MATDADRRRAEQAATRVAAHLAVVLFLFSASAVLLAVWFWDLRWLLTGGVLAVIALFFGIVASAPRGRGGPS